MGGDHGLQGRHRLVAGIRAGGIILSLASVGLLVWAWAMPLPSPPPGKPEPVLSVAEEAGAAAQPVLEPLLAKLAGTILIRPAQLQAAVKNDGTAERLLKKLKLQGVVQVGNDFVAYIQVDEGTKPVRSVCRGQTILDFIVEDVEAGRVKLSLQGVVVVLGHG